MKEKIVGLKGQVQSLQPFFHFFFLILGMF